jgi:hypothetical protein
MRHTSSLFDRLSIDAMRAHRRKRNSRALVPSWTNA